MATAADTKHWQAEKSALECHACMFDHSLATDITFVVTNTQNRRREKDDASKDKYKTVKCHKYILVSRSSVFWAMLCGQMAESLGEITIKDVDPEAFYHVIRYMYTDEIKLDPELVMFVWYIAKKYMLNTLITKCTQFLDQQVSPENVAIILDQCLFFDEKELIEKCNRILRANTSDALKSTSFVDIQQTTLNCILDDNFLIISEVEIFKACQKWAERKAEEREIEISGPNLRGILGDTLDKIRFPIIPSDSFSQVVSESEILDPMVELKLLRFIAATAKNRKLDLPYSLEQRCQADQTKKLFRNIAVNEYEVVSGKAFKFELEIKSESELCIQGLYIYDVDINHTTGNPQNQSSFAVTVKLNGTAILQSCTSKEDVPDNRNIKIIRFKTRLPNTVQNLTVEYHVSNSVRCNNCGKPKKTTGSCNHCGFVSISLFHQMPPVSASASLPLLKKSEIELKDEFVSVKISNKSAAHMPVPGLLYTL